LGTVTAACLANRGFEVVGLDPNTKTIDGLNCGKAPLYEPGLDKHLESGLEAGRLTFTTDIKSAVGHTDIVWVTFDTPIDEDEKADIDFVFDRIIDTFSYLRDDTMIIISSQLPVGSIRKVEREFMECKSDRRVSFCCIPENLRLGQAIESFLNPDRIVVGIRDNGMRPIIGRLLSPISSELVWVGVESAEMSKHALNAFLAMSIVYSNEIAGICERVNADSIEVENTLRTESRVGRSAYIRPGEAFSGGTLARDSVRKVFSTSIESAFTRSQIPAISLLYTIDMAKNALRACFDISADSTPTQTNSLLIGESNRPIIGRIPLSRIPTTIRSGLRKDSIA
jgi:UDPglucose 6-dehydrogenase